MTRRRHATHDALRSAVAPSHEPPPPILSDEDILARQWYAVYTECKGERLAHRELVRAGYACYLPQEIRWVSHARRKQAVQRPLFSRYVFVGVDPVIGWGPSLSTIKGVEWVLGGYDGSAMIPVRAILSIAGAEREGRFDRTVEPPARPRLAPGTPVRFLSGPYQGWEAKVLAAPSAERLVVTLKMFGTDTKATVDRAAVDPVGNDSALAE